MTQSAIIPRVRTGIHKIHAPISRCGDHWFESVRVRSPYKSTDKAFRTLESLGDRAQVEDFDTGFPEEMAADSARIAAFVEKSGDSLGPEQRKNIAMMLGRANDYIAAAQVIGRVWAAGFEAPHSGTVPSWPLGSSPRGQVDESISEGHRRDCAKWQRLVIGGLRNLRCAEEVAKKASVRARNKELRDGRAYAATAVAVVPRSPEPTSDHGIHASLSSGDISLDGESSSTASTAESKKDDNTMLIVGAAAIGLLLMLPKK